MLSNIRCSLAVLILPFRARYLIRFSIEIFNTELTYPATNRYQEAGSGPCLSERSHTLRIRVCASTRASSIERYAIEQVNETKKTHEKERTRSRASRS